MKQTANLVSATRNKYGDQVLQTKSAVACRFRYSTELERAPSREGEAPTDALVWFESDIVVTEGSIIEIEEKYWRITHITKARKMSGDTVEFLKCSLVVHEMVTE